MIILMWAVCEAEDSCLIELVQDFESKQPLDPALLLGRKICQLATDRGVWIRPPR